MPPWNGWPRCTLMSPRSGASPNGHESTNSSSATTFRLSHTQSRKRNGHSAPAKASAGQLPQAAMACAERCPGPDHDHTRIVVLGHDTTMPVVQAEGTLVGARAAVGIDGSDHGQGAVVLRGVGAAEIVNRG